MRRRGPWFVILWLVAATAAGWLYHKRKVTADLIGLVETRSHLLAAQEDGRVSVLLVEIGQRVERGQAVALLDVSDLEAERAQLERELAVLGEVMEADRQRFALEHEVLTLSVAERQTDQAARRAQLVSRRAEAAALDAEIARLQSAEQAGLGHARQMGDLKIRRQALAEFVRSLAAGIRSAPGAAGAIRGLTTHTESVLTSKGGNRLERVLQVRDRLALLGERERKRVATAPADGFIVEILARAGDAVRAFTPILAMEEEATTFVEVYVPEMSNVEVREGVAAEVISKRAKGGSAAGVVSFVHPGYERVPDRLLFRGQLAWARKVRVRLEPKHSLRPGESVRVRLAKTESTLPWTQLSHAARPDAGRRPPAPQAGHRPGDGGLTRMRISPRLKARTRLEPSGAVWLADLRRFLLVSDDTGHRGDENHAPWVFLMDSEGRVDDAPVVVGGLGAVNDLEAVTRGGNDAIYLLTSGSVNKHGERNPNRELLLKCKRQGAKLTVEARVGLLPLIERSLPAEEIRALGLTKVAADGRPALDFEALAYHEGALWFGLKEPTSAEGALLWRLDRPELIFSGRALEPGQLSLAARVPLGEHRGRSAGFSDLIVAPSGGGLIAAATFPGAPDSEQLGLILELRRDEAGAFTTRVIRRYVGLKPEGLAVGPDARLLVVFDTGEEATPLFAHLPGPR